MHCQRYPLFHQLQLLLFSATITYVSVVVRSTNQLQDNRLVNPEFAPLTLQCDRNRHIVEPTTPSTSTALPVSKSCLKSRDLPGVDKTVEGGCVSFCLRLLLPIKSRRQSVYKISQRSLKGWSLNANEQHLLLLVGNAACNGSSAIGIANDQNGQIHLSIAFSTNMHSCMPRFLSHIIDNIAFGPEQTATISVNLPYNTGPYFLCARQYMRDPFGHSDRWHSILHKREVEGKGINSNISGIFTRQHSGSTELLNNGTSGWGSDDAMSQWVHQGNGSDVIITTTKPIMPGWLMVCSICVLLSVSGLFSGLNLGLMSLTPQDLDVIIAAEEDKQIVGYAQKIMPLRKRGNFLLCTILLGNVLVNATATVLLEEIIDGILAIIGSTIGIVIFGEIIPQAICSRKGLVVGAKTVGLTKLFMLLTFLISYPLSKILDYALGPDVGSSYTRRQILELVKRTTKDIEQHEMAIVAGALTLKSKAVGDLMTPLSEVFMIDGALIVNSVLMIQIYKEGYTRVPVYLQSRKNIIGLINIRDFAFVDLEGNMTVKEICAYFEHPVGHVAANANILSLLEEFKKGDYHIALVEQTRSDGSTLPLGIVTLEDIVEEIIQSQIYDEWDNVEKDISQPRRHKKNRAPDFSLFIHPQRSVESIISVQQKIALFQYLSAVVRPFHPTFIDHNVLKRLLNNEIVLVEFKRGRFQPDHPNVQPPHGGDARPAKAGSNSSVSTQYMARFNRGFGLSRNNDNNARIEGATIEGQGSGSYVYQYGKPADYFAMIISGKAVLETGRERITSIVGPFSYFGTLALCEEDDDVESVIRSSTARPKLLIPDFSLRLIEDTTYIRVTRELYVAAVRASVLEKRQQRVSAPVMDNEGSPTDSSAKELNRTSQGQPGAGD